MATTRTTSRQNGSQRVSTSVMRDDLEELRTDIDKLIEHVSKYARQEIRHGLGSTGSVAGAMKEKASEGTEKLRGFVNVNYLRFERTEPLELLLFQAPIHHSIGVDSSIGVRYRPPLTENIQITAGAAALVPGQGLRDIYTGKMMFSLFSDIKFQF